MPTPLYMMHTLNVRNQAPLGILVTSLLPLKDGEIFYATQYLPRDRHSSGDISTNEFVFGYRR